MKIINDRFRFYFLLIFFAEILSLCGFLLPSFNSAAFVIISLLFFALTIYRLEYGLLISLAELIIGSKGYLFYLDLQGPVISLRIAFWLIIMVVWAGGFLVDLIKKRKEAWAPYQQFRFIWAYFFLGAFFVAGLAIASVKHNELSNIYFDANGWIYFLIILPWISYFQKAKDPVQNIARVFSAASFWLAVETLFLLFVFSHNLSGMVFELYRWVRTTGVGEITLMPNGFYRIFFQSQIFALFGWLIVWFLLFFRENKEGEKSRKERCWLFAALLAFSVILILSFSRSFWLALVVAGLFAAVYSFRKSLWRSWLRNWLKTASVFLAAFFLIILVARFPFPAPSLDFNATSLLSDRAALDNNEAAVSSRWALLPELWKEIKVNPILGAGFGKTVTYHSSDPRVASIFPDGEYTTFAFEWGWLDIWLKMGLGGIISYLSFLAVLFWIGLKRKKPLSSGLSAAVLALAVLNVFTPYLNHPLGIIFLVIASLLIDYSERGGKRALL